MRRPAPPPPPAEFELDYGSADTPSGSGVQLVEVRNEVEVPTVSRTRKVIAYETDQIDAPISPPDVPSNGDPTPFDSKAPPPGIRLGDNAMYPRQASVYGSESHVGEGLAAAGPSSPQPQALNFSPHEGLPGGSSTGYADPYPPPLPAYPPPDLPFHHAYNPNAPEFYPIAPVPANYDLALSEPYSHQGHVLPAELLPYSDAPRYDPHASYSYPYGESDQYSHLAPYPVPSASFQLPYPGHLDNSYAAEYPPPQMDQFQQKKLLKQQRKKEKKQRKREQKQQKQVAQVAAHNARLSAYTNGAPCFAVDATDEADVTWVEDGKFQAVAMVKELHTRGVPPQRLTEKGVPMRMVQACCNELGISAQDQASQEVDAPASLFVPTSVDEQGMNPPADNKASVKREESVALTPLEELRKKVLASRLPKVTAPSTSASSASNAAEAVSSGLSSVPTVFDRTATSGEADALLSQIGESIRSLMRPSHEAGAATLASAPVEDSAREPALPSSRKRAYRDVDAVDDMDATVTASLIGDEQASAPLPSRRQRISYADNFSRAAETPSGEVDLSAPVPDLPAAPASAASLPLVSDAVARRRPVAADFDAKEYRPQILRSNRFLDIPSGLNTVVDLSDDEFEDEELDSFERSKFAGLDLDASDLVLLRQRTANEHYDNFCALHGLQPIRRVLTPARDGATRTMDAANDSTSVDGVPNESLLAELVAANGVNAGSSTPNREELLRKELEIKRLMQRIQMMEERKFKHQAAATPSPSASPMTGRNFQSAATKLAPLGLSPGPSQPLTVTTQAASVPASVFAPSAEVNAPPVQQPSSSVAVKLDPALQKKREELLTLLASRRKNVTTRFNAAKESLDSSGGALQDDGVTASNTEHAGAPPASVTRSQTMNPGHSVDREEVSFSDIASLQSSFKTIDTDPCPTSATFGPLSHSDSPWRHDTDQWCRVYSTA